MRPIYKEMVLTRVESFCAAHRLHSNLLSDEANHAVYGKCNNPNGHGHNYRVKVSVRGSVDPKTGMIMNISDLKQIIDEKVLCVLDHQNLDRDVGYFRDSGIPSTAENIANFIFDQMASSLPIGVTVDSVKLHETDKNIVEIRTRKEQSM
jgi:6-pyruvoyltetrahydropterin/6-carboxytetrahydropterin synthase